MHLRQGVLAFPRPLQPRQQQAFGVHPIAGAVADKRRGDAFEVGEHEFTVFTFDDFLQAQRMLRRMGPLQGLMKMIPGMGEIASSDIDERRFTQAEAIVLSMTPRERARLGIPDGFLRFSIGVEDVDDLIADLSQALG